MAGTPFDEIFPSFFSFFFYSKKQAAKHLFGRPTTKFVGGEGYDIFRYLLSLCQIKECRTEAEGNSKSLFSALLQLPSNGGDTRSALTFPCLNIFMQHRDFDINGKINPKKGLFVTPPQALSREIIGNLIALERQDSRQKRFRMYLRGAEILIEAGADPNLSFPDAPSQIQLSRQFRRYAEGQFLAQPQNTASSFYEERGKY